MLAIRQRLKVAMKLHTVGDRLVRSSGVWKQVSCCVLRKLNHGGQRCNCAILAREYCRMLLANLSKSSLRGQGISEATKLTILFLVVSRRELPLAAKELSAISTI
jgi:hypothetical protein